MKCLRLFIPVDYSFQKFIPNFLSGPLPQGWGNITRYLTVTVCYCHYRYWRLAWLFSQPLVTFPHIHPLALDPPRIVQTTSCLFASLARSCHLCRRGAISVLCLNSPRRIQIRILHHVLEQLVRRRMNVVWLEQGWMWSIVLKVYVFCAGFHSNLELVIGTSLSNLRYENSKIQLCGQGMIWLLWLTQVSSQIYMYGSLPSCSWLMRHGGRHDNNGGSKEND